MAGAGSGVNSSDNVRGICFCRQPRLQRPDWELSGNEHGSKMAVGAVGEIDANRMSWFNFS